MIFELGLLFWCEFGQPVYRRSGLCACVAGEFAWYVLLWNLLALGWWLFSVFVYHILNPLNSFVFRGFFVLFCETFNFIICTKILYCLLALLKKKHRKHVLKAP